MRELAFRFLEGEWELVRDLRLQQYLPSEIKDGRTLVSVPLETEPCTLLALIPKPKLTFADYKTKLTAYTASGDILMKNSLPPITGWLMQTSW